MVNAIVPVEHPRTIQLPPVEVAVARAATASNIIRHMKDTGILKDKNHYGIIPGTSKKPTLYKPGAEFLCKAFGYDPVFDVSVRTEDWDKPLFHYEVTCHLIDIESGLEVATGSGSCNSMEAKYRYRWVKADLLPQFGLTIETTVKNSYGSYRVPNDDIYSLVNTILKMACKRALIAAALIGTGASQFFTQDIEDIKEHLVPGIVDDDTIDEDFGEDPIPGESAPTASWANADTLLSLGQYVYKHITSAGFQGDTEAVSAEVAKVITTATGITLDRSNRKSYAAWNRKYPTGKAAFEAIKAAYDGNGTVPAEAAPEESDDQPEPITEFTDADWDELDLWAWETFGIGSREIYAAFPAMQGVSKAGFPAAAFVLATTAENPFPMLIGEIKRSKSGYDFKLPHDGKAIAVPEKRLEFLATNDTWAMWLLTVNDSYQAVPEDLYLTARLKSGKWTVIDVALELPDAPVQDDPEAEAV